LGAAPFGLKGCGFRLNLAHARNDDLYSTQKPRSAPPSPHPPPNPQPANNQSVAAPPVTPCPLPPGTSFPISAILRSASVAYPEEILPGAFKSLMSSSLAHSRRIARFLSAGVVKHQAPKIRRIPVNYLNQDKMETPQLRRHNLPFATIGDACPASGDTFAAKTLSNDANPRQNPPAPGNTALSIRPVLWYGCCLSTL
jgi:hypothetical protein